MSPDEFDLPACLERVRQRDPDAGRALVEHLYPLVIKIVRAHRPRRMAEEDLAQEVFMKMFVRLEQYEARNGVPFSHWVSRMAVRTCLDALRAERRRPEWREADLSTTDRAWLDFLAGQSAAPVEAEAESAREVVARLLELLSPEDRLVITLLDLHEKSVEEISSLTGWGHSLVKVRAFRARQKLRTHAMRLKNQSKL